MSEESRRATPQEIARYLKAQGFSNLAIAGILGNHTVKVVGDPNALNATFARIEGKLKALPAPKRGRIIRLLSMLEHLSRRRPPER